MGAVVAVGTGVLAGGCIACRCAPPPALAGWGAVSALGFGTAAAALTTRAPGPRTDGTVFGGAVVGAAAAMLVGGAALAAGVLATTLAVLAGRRSAPGVLPVTFGAPLFYGALAVGRPADGVLPWVLATWLLGLRALLRTDAGAGPGRVWLPAALALAYVPASFLGPARSGYSGFYFLTVLFADLALLVVATRLVVGRADRLTGLVTTALGVSVVALVIGRVL